MQTAVDYLLFLRQIYSVRHDSRGFTAEIQQQHGNKRRLPAVTAMQSSTSDRALIENIDYDLSVSELSKISTFILKLASEWVLLF